MNRESDRVGYQLVTVRENTSGENVTAVSLDSDMPKFQGIEDRGCGTDLHSPAHDEIRSTLELEEYEVGDEVARIWYDYDAWEYEIEYLVSLPIADRIRRWFR